MLKNKNKQRPRRGAGQGTTFRGSHHALAATAPWPPLQTGQASLWQHRPLTVGSGQAFQLLVRVPLPHGLLRRLRLRLLERAPFRMPVLVWDPLPQLEGETPRAFFSVKLPSRGPFSLPPLQNQGGYQSPRHVSSCSEYVTPRSKADLVPLSNSFAILTGF